MKHLLIKQTKYRKLAAKSQFVITEQISRSLWLCWCGTGLLSDVDTDVIRALAGIGMQPQALIANAFQNLAGNAEKIGHLNITPDLIREMMTE